MKTKKTIHVQYIISVHDLEKMFHLEEFLKRMGFCYNVRSVYFPEHIKNIFEERIKQSEEKWKK